VARYPRSPRRNKASVILGWLLVDAHEPEEADSLFSSAMDDPRREVRTSARAGLQAVSKKKP
jgi:hypothetical protein